MTESSAEAVCPQCMRAFPAPVGRLGRRVRCPWCEQRFPLSVERITKGLDPEQCDGWYYLARDGQRVGPINLSELMEARDSAALTGDTQLWRESWPRWKFAEELFSSLGGTRTEVERPARVEHQPMPPSENPLWKRWSEPLRNLYAALERAIRLIRIVAIIEFASVAVLALVSLVVSFSLLAAIPALLLHGFSVLMIAHKLADVAPAWKAWMETGEPRAGEVALRQATKAIPVLAAWAIATLISTIYAIAFTLHGVQG